MIVRFHHHDGFYNDGNSHYWSIDRLLDTDANTVTIEREESWGGQLAGNHQFAHKEAKTTESREAVALTSEQQAAIFDTLQPLVETAQKYPHLTGFRFFNQKHRYLITGRIAKARKLAEDSDYCGTDCLTNVWALVDFGMVVKAYANSREPGWTCELISLKGED